MEKLTKTELEILNAMARGETGLQTARRTHREEQTIKFHKSNLFKKLNVRLTPFFLAFVRGILLALVRVVQSFQRSAT